MVHQNSPTVEFLQEKIEGNLRRAKTEPSVDFRRANTERRDFPRASPSEISRSSPASPQKTPSFPPLLVRLTQATSYISFVQGSRKWEPWQPVVRNKSYLFGQKVDCTFYHIIKYLFNFVL